MHPLTELIKNDMKPALGVTEPGAIAFAASRARSYTNGPITRIHAALNSGMYKNAFTCGIPNSTEVGNVFAAALGAAAGKWEKGLASLEDVQPADNEAAQALVDRGAVTVSLDSISSDIFIQVTVETADDACTVTIRDKHTNIVRITLNGEEIFRADETDTESNTNDMAPGIHSYTLAQLVDYIETVDISEIGFIREAYDVNLALYQEGVGSDRTTFGPYLKKLNGGMDVSDDELKTAQLLCNAAIEARVIGLDRPAMSITGSGAHGIIATMPLYAVCQIRGLGEEKLLRATALSYLICTYIKEYSGRLSAFCGCAIAAGTGMACGLVWLWGGSTGAMTFAINNMASSITGMICDGGNQGCTMKGIAAVDAAFRSAEFGCNGICIDNVHGINGETPEITMKQMGLIASPGMEDTERVIVEIFEEKLRRKQNG